MGYAMERLEGSLELGGVKKDVTLLVISGAALIVSIFDLVPLPFDAAWVAIILCGVPIVLGPSSVWSRPSTSRPTCSSHWR